MSAVSFDFERVLLFLRLGGGEFEHHLQIFDALVELRERIDFPSDVVGFGDDLLRGFLVVPEISRVICASSSARRWFNLGTSKKPPQVRELVGGGGDLRFDEVEHRDKITTGRRNGRWKIIATASRVHLDTVLKSEWLRYRETL